MTRIPIRSLKSTSGPNMLRSRRTSEINAERSHAFGDFSNLMFGFGEEVILCAGLVGDWKYEDDVIRINLCILI